MRQKIYAESLRTSSKRENCMLCEENSLSFCSCLRQSIAVQSNTSSVQFHRIEQDHWLGERDSRPCVHRRLFFRVNSCLFALESLKNRFFQSRQRQSVHYTVHVQENDHQQRYCVRLGNHRLTSERCYREFHARLPTT